MTDRKLLIDVGSSSVKWAETSVGYGLTKGGSVPFPDRMVSEEPFYEVPREKVISVVREIVDGSDAESVFISVQMHGWLLADGEGNALTEYVSWRDGRGGLLPYGFGLSPENGVKLKPNLPRASVAVTEKLFPEKTAKAKKFFTLGSYIAYRLTGRNVTHITDAAASGFYNARTAEPVSCRLELPEATRGVEVAGDYRGKRVFTPVGDQQAAIFGSGASEDSYILNLGTAAQMCAVENSFAVGEYESRPYFRGKTLCTVTNLPGGGYLSLHAAEEGLVSRLAGQYLTAISALPKKSFLSVTGGTPRYYGSLFSSVFAEMGMKTVISGEKTEGLTGLKKLSEECCL